MKKFLVELKEYQYKLITEAILLVNFVFLWLRFGNSGTYVLLFYAVFFLVLSAINLVSSCNIGKGIIYPLLLLIYIYLIVQEVYYSAFEQYFLFKTALGAMNEVAGVQSSVMELIKPKTIITALLYFVNLLPVFFLKTKKTSVIKQKVVFIFAGVICFSFACLMTFGVERSIEKEMKQANVMQYYGTSYYFYYYIPNTNVFVNKFGVLGLLYRDTFAKMYIHPETQYGIDDELIIRVLNQIGEENKKSVNEYTDIFEGKNLVIFQGESLMNLAINPKLTPNLYKILNEGIYFYNFNAPLLYGSTSDTEFMAITSLVPVSTGELVFDSYNTNIYPTTLANMFINEGYISSAAHANYGNYYSRSVMYPNLGFDFMDFIALNVGFLEFDSVAINTYSWCVDWADSYFSYFISYNGHQPYSLDVCGNYPDSYYERIRAEYPDIADDMVCYLAKQMDFDKGIGFYINNIRILNQDTVFLVFGDHFAKGIKDESGTFTDKNDFKTPLIIWHNDVEPVQITKYSSTLDILPTIANMFGLEYDSRTVFGKDIFDENYHGFLFDNFGYYRTDNYFYDSNYDVITLANDSMTEEEARAELNEYILRLNVSRTIIETDFFGRYPEYGEMFGE